MPRNQFLLRITKLFNYVLFTFIEFQNVLFHLKSNTRFRLPKQKVELVKAILKSSPSQKHVEDMNFVPKSPGRGKLNGTPYSSNCLD